METNEVLSFVLVLALLGLSFLGYKYYTMRPQPSAGSCSQAAINLSKDMRKLWEDHVVWTRNYIISALSDLKV